MNEQPRHLPYYSVGTQVVILRAIIGQNGRTQYPRGGVGVVVKSAIVEDPIYRVRFPDGLEESCLPHDLTTLAAFQALDGSATTLEDTNGDLFSHVIYQCVIGSQAYGLADDASDVDRRGFYLPPAQRHWSLYGVPEILECEATQEAYWEIQKFLILALKANPNVLECLYTPIVEKSTPISAELLEGRARFLSRLVYQTFNGYALSQFKKMQADVRNQGRVKWKHVMHLLRLLMSGIVVLREGRVSVRVEDGQRERLLAVKRGELTWDETDRWRRQLHEDFDHALTQTRLPERPDYEWANDFLIRARQAACA